jgi:chromosome segregation ATPase
VGKPKATACAQCATKGHRCSRAKALRSKKRRKDGERSEDEEQEGPLEAGSVTDLRYEELANEMTKLQQRCSELEAEKEERRKRETKLEKRVEKVEKDGAATSATVEALGDIRGMFRQIMGRLDASRKMIEATPRSSERIREVRSKAEDDEDDEEELVEDVEMEEWAGIGEDGGGEEMEG